MFPLLYSINNLFPLGTICHSTPPSLSQHPPAHAHAQVVRKQQGVVTTTYYDSALESRVKGDRAPQMPVNLLAVVFDKFACIQEDYTHTHTHTHTHTL